MNVKVTLDADDYLTYHLFLASKSDSLKKRRFIHWFSIPLVYIVSGFVFTYLKGSEMVRTIFFGTALIWFVLYPFYSKWAVRRYLFRQVAARYANLIGKEGSLTLGEKKITVKSHEASMDITYADIKDVIELPDHVLVELHAGSSLILPRKKISPDELAQVVAKIISKTEIKPKVQILWGWK